jgi:uncharacterized protein YjbI with pentapeptide repeats
MRRPQPFLFRASPEQFIVYGDLNGPFKLATSEGVPVGLIAPPSNWDASKRALGVAPDYATFQAQQTDRTWWFVQNGAGVISSDEDSGILWPDPLGYQDADAIPIGLDLQVPGLGTIQSKGGVGCDLSHVDLTGAQLSGVDLSRANLQNANLTGAKLVGAILDGADLSGAILSGADLSGAQLKGATLSTDLTQAIFNSLPVFSNEQSGPTSFKNATLKFTLLGRNWSYLDLTGARFVDTPAGLDLTQLQAIHVKAPGINLSGTKLCGAVLSDADLGGATLTGADFTGATLTRTDFSGATLLGAKFIHCDLTQATFSPNPTFGTEKEPASLAGATIKYALIGQNWSYLDLTGTTFAGGLPVDHTRRVDLTGLHATRTKVPNINLSGAKLVNADLTGADLTGADLAGADLSGAKLLGGALLLKAVLLGANLTGAHIDAKLGGEDRSLAANLTYAFLEHTIIDSDDLSGVDFSFATLIGTSFTAPKVALEQAGFANAYLENVTFGSNPVLRGTNFANACLISCNLTGADLSPSASGSIQTKLEGAFIQGAMYSGASLQGADLANAVVAFDHGSIQTQYCGADGKPTSPWPMRYEATTGLDETTLKDDTVCPNGITYATNKQAGKTLTQMLTLNASDVPTKWGPVGCKSWAQVLEEARAARLVRRP